MTIARSRFFDSFAHLESCGSYDEIPVLPFEVDPQVHVSLADRPQPFYLICEKDTMLVQMSGAATIKLVHPQVRYFQTVPGDYVYIPAGTPHLIEPKKAGMIHRYKAATTELEGVAWYCASCQQEVHREVWRYGDEPPQAAYARFTEAFNQSEEQRTCKTCATIHPPVSLEGTRWAELAVQKQ